MSHGRMYVFSNKELTTDDKLDILERVESEKVPNPYDYMVTFRSPENYVNEVRMFEEWHSTLKHEGNKYHVTLKDAYDDMEETKRYEPAESEVANYLRAKYHFESGSYACDSFVIVTKYDDGLEWTYGITLFDALITAYHWKDMYEATKSGLAPDMAQSHDLILSDIYDYHY